MPTPEAPLWANTQYLYDICHAIAQAATALVTPAPTRVLVSHGPPCWDCGDQLTVNIDRIRSSSMLPITMVRAHGSKNFVPVADINVWLLRCVTGLTSDSEIPTAAVLDTEALHLAQDGQALWGGLISQSIAGTLFPSIHEGTFVWRECVPVGPNSGLAGWKATVEVSLA